MVNTLPTTASRVTIPSAAPKPMAARLLPPEQRRSAMVGVKVTEAQRLEAERLAERTGTTLSGLLRQALADRLATSAD